MTYLGTGTPGGKKKKISQYTLLLSVLHESVLSSGIDEWNFLEMPSKGVAHAPFYPPGGIWR